MTHHHPHNTRLVRYRVEKVAQKVRANILLGDVVPDERKQRIEPHQIGFVLRHKQAHGVGKLLNRLHRLSEDRKAVLQGRGCLLRRFYSQPARKRFPEAFQKRLQSHFRPESKATSDASPA